MTCSTTLCLYCESYCKPVKGNLKINMKKYCKKDYGKTVRPFSASFIKFTVFIHIKKHSFIECRGDPLKRGDNVLWVHMKDLACKCPKIQIGKRFLVTGSERVGLVADKNSLVIQWRDVWARRLRKFQRKEKKGKCGKA
uniref:NTR domain-containing protein n=1 Tax=Neogobius melanostomus TaxID=47308 RepID=A0A8C6STC7_9GOBI